MVDEGASGGPKTLCPVCQRKVEKLYRTKVWKGDVEGVEFLCYACKFNVFPPESEPFNRVQEWRAAHGLSVRNLSAAQVEEAKAKKVAKVAKAEGEPQPDWGVLRADQMLKEEMDKKAHRYYAEHVFCAVCPTECTEPVLVEVPAFMSGSSKPKRKAVWGYCSIAHYAQYVEKFRKMRTGIGAFPKVWDVTGGGRRLVGLILPGKGRVGHTDETEPEKTCLVCFAEAQEVVA